MDSSSMYLVQRSAVVKRYHRDMHDPRRFSFDDVLRMSFLVLRDGRGRLCCLDYLFVQFRGLLNVIGNWS
jgi:hypothetical protein